MSYSAGLTWSVSKTIRTETGHRLLYHPGKCSRLHGHSYEWEVILHAPKLLIPERGMFVDFGLLKAAMRYCIHNALDHQFVLNEKDALCNSFKAFAAGAPIDEENAANNGIVVLSHEPTAENLAARVAADLAVALAFPGTCASFDLNEDELQQAKVLKQHLEEVDLLVSVKETATSAAEVSGSLDAWCEMAAEPERYGLPVWRAAL